ncbi:hypothetical protein [Acetobacter orientalis]|uniref:hypothetical protein n=1 Tax=Acetobacter orientalis TaxID=146474 RepID=UPI0039ECC86B
MSSSHVDSGADAGAGAGSGAVAGAVAGVAGFDPNVNENFISIFIVYAHFLQLTQIIYT